MEHPVGSTAEAQIDPPRSSTMPFAIVSPSPLPPEATARSDSTRSKRSKTLASSAAGIPGPLSEMATATESTRSLRTVTVIGSPGGLVPDGVVDEVREHLMETLGIGRDHKALRTIDNDYGRGRAEESLLNDRVDDADKLHWLEMQRDGSGFQARQVEQLLDESTQPVGLAQHCGQGLGLVLDHVVHEVLEVALDHGDGSPQLVADVRDQIPALLLQAGNMAGHLVERPTELADFVGTGRGDALFELSSGHRVRGSGHLSQR